MIPFPVLVPVMVSVFDPVSRVPSVMFTVAAAILLCRITAVVAAVWFTLRILKVVAPVILEG
jgi:hypothetical protein